MEWNCFRTTGFQLWCHRGLTIVASYDEGMFKAAWLDHPPQRWRSMVMKR
jgi:hypothetical protein